MLHIEKFKSKIADRLSRAPYHGTSFASDVLMLVGGTAFAQALAVLASPVLTRLYSPEAYGVASLFMAITGVIGAVACLRYEMAIMLPEKDEEAANLLGLSLLISATLSILSVPVIWLGQQQLLRLLNAQELAPYMWLVPPTVFLSGAFLALNYWNSRTKRFGRLSIARINASASTTVTQIGAGLLGYPTGGSLIGGRILGSMVSAFVLGAQIWRDDHKKITESIRHNGMLEGLKRHRKFPIIDIWSALLNSTSSQLPIFILSVYFPSAVVGYYAIGHNVLQLPMSFIGSSIGQVFFQRASMAKLEGTLSTIVESTFTRLIMIGLFPILIMCLIGKDVFIVFFGNPWAEAGIYAQILAPWIFFVFITSPITTLFAIFEKQGTSLLINIGLFIARIITLMAGGLLGSARLALALYACVGVIIWIYVCIWVLHISEVRVMPIIRKTVVYLCYCLPSVAAIIICKYILHLSAQIIIIVSIVGAILYYFSIIKNEEIIKTFIPKFLFIKK